MQLNNQRCGNTVAVAMEKIDVSNFFEDNDDKVSCMFDIYKDPGGHTGFSIFRDGRDDSHWKNNDYHFLFSIKENS